MNTENKSKLTLSNCVCDICQCFNNKLENKQYTHVKCKLNDKVKLWNRYEGIVKFIGPIHFKSNVSVILVGIELNSHRQRGYPQIKGFKMNPNYKLIQKNRELYKTIDPILYQLRFRR
ncbi:unnamed protein product [Schistosoma mattheei]|uniref:Uncharacterized protein n=1 Tax=Schistosoma mattheei TaxID=31246 RepID=A0AA85C0W1_9TREM|nr:unnamed protein product [Schistosoma mattheei]